MGSRKKKPEPKPVEPLRGRPPRGYEVHGFQVRIPKTLHKQLLAALSQTRRTQNSEVQIAIEKHLESLGLWPAPESESD